VGQLVGIDLGTSAVKALAFDYDTGRVAAIASEPLPSYRPRRDWVKHDPAILWQTVATCLHRLWDAIAAESVAGVAVASMGEAGVLLDGNDRPVYPIIAWHDPRTVPQMDWLARQIAPWEVFRITGQQWRPIYSVFKLLWLRENEPAAFRTGERWLCIADYIMWRLAGVHVTDRTVGSRTMLLDQARGRWSASLLDIAQLDGNLLPEVVLSGTRVGHVTPDAAQETGLRAGTPVCTGGHDHLCGAFAAGILGPGQILDSSGTAQSVLTLTPEWHPTRTLFDSGLTYYRYVLDGLFILQGGLTMAGGMLRWLGDLLAATEEADYQALLEAAAAAPAGANGVTCLPYLRGKPAPTVDSGARGAVLGLTATTTRGDVARATLEGLAYHLRELVEAFDALLGTRADEITAIGGTNQPGLLPQIKADVTGRAVRVPSVPEAVALGAALLAGLGVGVFATAQEAAARSPRRAQTHLPDAALAELYAAGYDCYRALYRQLRIARSSGQCPTGKAD
jgi:xylulokinase